MGKPEQPRPEKLRDLDLKNFGQRRQELQAELDELRPVLVEAIRAAYHQRGWSQIEIVRATGYTREMVRRIVGGSPT